MARETGEVLPALQSRVMPRLHLHFVWHAFGKLSTERAVGMGLGPIPVVSGIQRYARDQGISDIDRFETLIREMDTAWLKHMAERLKGS